MDLQIHGYNDARFYTPRVSFLLFLLPNGRVAGAQRSNVAYNAVLCRLSLESGDQSCG
jgi:hypothetical protein